MHDLSYGQDLQNNKQNFWDQGCNKVQGWLYTLCNKNQALKIL
jgi:hypothetical protein